MIVFIIISSLPILIIFYFIDLFESNPNSQQTFVEKYSNNLKELEGKSFFCYNNRKDSKNYIEKNLIPFLPKNVEIIYLNGKEIDSSFDKEFISQAFYNFEEYQRFPHLFKIKNGQIEEKSINNSFYNWMNLKHSKNILMDQIHLFIKS
ncbi:hypothetical protein [Aureivirga sp. CE67]|uniref:hypothetical protein n=1 Tax=Aureivirga sp. CE67 TaxID=1788983 RepID=UPI0018CB928E|nr:hypothetical protein [Aureivirga sp. CE67]